MRNLFLTINLLMIFYNLDAQQLSENKDVKKVVVYPTCEKFITNQDIQTCFGKNLFQIYSKVLDSELEDFQKFRMSEVKSKIQFIVDKKGAMINFKIIEGNVLLGERVISVLDDYHKNISIKPAIGNDDLPVNLVMQIPLKIALFNIFEKELEIFKESGAKELVYLTLNEYDETYEIRLKQDLTFSIHKIINDKYEFLGNVMNWLEFQNMEPFSKHINQLFTEQWELITEDELNGEKYRIYRWGYDLEYVRVYKLVNGKEELVLESNRLKKFKKSPYLKLLFRN